MNVYLVEFDGFIYHGQMFVVTTSVVKALSIAKKKLREMGLSHENRHLNEFHVSRIYTKEEHVYVINDGDY